MRVAVAVFAAPTTANGTDTLESLAFDGAPVRAAGPNREYAFTKASSLM
jgi:hypothetical protein